MSTSSDPVQARHIVGPELDPNFLQSYQQTTLVVKELICANNKCADLPAHRCCLIYTISICCLMRSSVANLVEH